MANKIDANASSPNRIRRNFQRLAKTGIAASVTPGDTSLKLINGNLAVNVAPNGGLQTEAAGLAVFGEQQLATDPTSPTTGEAWFNSTNSTEELAISPTLIGHRQTVIFVNTAVITNTASTVRANVAGYSITFPNGYMNLLGRTIRATVVLSFTQLAFALQQNLLFNLAGFDVAEITSNNTTGAATVLVQWDFTVSTTGTNGVVTIVGTQFSSSAPIYATASEYGQTGTFDITGAFTFSLGTQSTSTNASDNIQVLYMLVEAVY